MLQLWRAATTVQKEEGSMNKALAKALARTKPKVYRVYTADGRRFYVGNIRVYDKDTVKRLESNGFSLKVVPNDG